MSDAAAHLSKVDKILGRLIRKAGPFTLTPKAKWPSASSLSGKDKEIRRTSARVAILEIMFDRLAPG